MPEKPRRLRLPASFAASRMIGLVFLKYLSDAYENRHRFLTRAITDPANTEYYVKEAPRHLT